MERCSDVSREVYQCGYEEGLMCRIWKEQGPFDGMFGFSQGTSLLPDMY